METSHATLKQYRQSPRKVRLVADFVRGKNVTKALGEVIHLPKRATDVIVTLIKSAVANAKIKGLKEESLFIKEIHVNEAKTLKRSQPASRGRAHPINKRSSHIHVVLGEVANTDTK